MAAEKLARGAIKGGLKTGPSAYLSPQDVAKGKKKTPGEVPILAAANVPSAIVRDLLRTICDDPRYLVPATVVLKLNLRYGATALAKRAAASVPAHPPDSSAGQSRKTWPQPAVRL
jgi:hypothetical protein